MLSLKKARIYNIFDTLCGSNFCPSIKLYWYFHFSFIDFILLIFFDIDHIYIDLPRGNRYVLVCITLNN